MGSYDHTGYRRTYIGNYLVTGILSLQAAGDGADRERQGCVSKELRSDVLVHAIPVCVIKNYPAGFRFIIYKSICATNRHEIVSCLAALF